MREREVIAERYELAELLGSGAEARVFRADDLLSGDEIAVKIFHPTALQNPAALKAFKRDLAVLRDGSHPNVVRVFDFGQTAGSFYVAMELVRGAPVSSETGWSHTPVLEVFEQVADALVWLHARGVVHGDIRADNIIRS